MTPLDAMKQALDALEDVDLVQYDKEFDDYYLDCCKSRAPIHSKLRHIEECSHVKAITNLTAAIKVMEEAKKEVTRKTNCIRGLTEQCAALVVEKNSLIMDHGGSLCDRAKIEFLEGLLAGDNALITGLKNDLADCQQQRDELVRDAERYRWLRTQNPRQYQELWNYCLNSDVMFDDQVDECIAEAALAKLGADKTGEVG